MFVSEFLTLLKCVCALCPPSPFQLWAISCSFQQVGPIERALCRFQGKDKRVQTIVRWNPKAWKAAGNRLHSCCEPTVLFFLGHFDQTTTLFQMEGTEIAWRANLWCVPQTRADLLLRPGSDQPVNSTQKDWRIFTRLCASMGGEGAVLDLCAGTMSAAFGSALARRKVVSVDLD